MIIDSSAVIAILRNEPDAPAFARLLEAAAISETPVRISAVNFTEAAILIDGSRDPVASRRFDELIRTSGIRVETVTAEQARIAREAFRDFGRGHGHPAKLNFGDCFAYALARDRGEPLLFKNNDFALTDIEPAYSSS